MKFNKYLIAAMITVGVMKAASAQNNNHKNAINSYQIHKKNGPDAWVINSAKQTQEMKRELALNESQLKEIKRINDSHAREIEVARVECGEDVTGFNSYIDRVSNARDRELRSVLTPEQFAYYTSKKNSKNWLGMDKFRYISEDGELKVKNNKDELKIKGKNNAAAPDMSSNAFRNNNDIIIDSVSVTEGIIPDTSANGRAPEIKIFPGGVRMDTNSDQAANKRLNERVKSEYNNMYADSASASNKKCKEVNKKSSKSGSTHKKTGVFSKSKTTAKSGTKSSKSKSTAKAPSKSKSNASALKSTTKKTTTAKSGNVKKKKKTTESASAKKKMEADTCNNMGSSKMKQGMPDTSARSGIPMDTTASSGEIFMVPDTTATIIVIPDSSTGIIDTTSSASAKSPNYFINKDSKAKFSKGESKIKPTNHNKMKETDSESKSKNGNSKVKDEKNETKVKDKDWKIKINK
jgi:hypothetical protein